MTALLAEMIATVVLAKGRRTTRGYFKCCCPAHDDQRPSLLIFVKADGRLSFGVSLAARRGASRWR